MAQAKSSSVMPLLRKRAMSLSNRPVLIRSAMIIGFEVAPVIPQERLRAISSGSMPSSHTFVPVAINDCIGVLMSRPPFADGILLLLYGATLRRWRIVALQLEFGNRFAMDLI